MTDINEITGAVLVALVERAAAAVVQAGSNILIERIGATGVDATGEWS